MYNSDLQLYDASGVKLRYSLFDIRYSSFISSLLPAPCSVSRSLRRRLTHCKSLTTPPLILTYLTVYSDKGTPPFRKGGESFGAVIQNKKPNRCRGFLDCSPEVSGSRSMGGLFKTKSRPADAGIGFLFPTPYKSKLLTEPQIKKTGPEYSGPAFCFVGSTGFEPVTPCL